MCGSMSELILTESGTHLFNHKSCSRLTPFDNDTRVHSAEQTRPGIFMSTSCRICVECAHTRAVQLNQHGVYNLRQHKLWTQNYVHVVEGSRNWIGCQPYTDDCGKRDAYANNEYGISE